MSSLATTLQVLLLCNFFPGIIYLSVRYSQASYGHFSLHVSKLDEDCGIDEGEGEGEGEIRWNTR